MLVSRFITSSLDLALFLCCLVLPTLSLTSTPHTVIVCTYYCWPKKLNVSSTNFLPCLPSPGAASASPARRLLGSQLGYIPSGCPLTVSVVAEESQPSWFQDAPEIRGSVTLSNPSQYNVPIDNIIVQARSSDGMQYSTTASCDGGSSTTVPYNPVPYTYGTATCRYRIVLDRRVFGSYGQSGNRRRLQGSGAVQANFFPSSSSSGGSNGGNSGSSGGYGYFPPPSSRPTWTVTAIATIRFSNAQCLSAPTTVNTDCWWNWLVSWHQQHHHKGWWWSGRRLAMAAAAPSQGQNQPSEVPGTLPARQLSGEHHHNPHHGHHMHAQQHGSSVSRSLLNANNQHGGGFGFVVSGGSVHHGGQFSSSSSSSRRDLGLQDARGGSVSSIDDAADSVDAAVDNIESKEDA